MLYDARPRSGDDASVCDSAIELKMSAAQGDIQVHRERREDVQQCYPLDIDDEECETCEFDEDLSDYYGEDIWMCSSSVASAYTPG